MCAARIIVAGFSFGPHARTHQTVSLVVSEQRSLRLLSGFTTLAGSFEGTVKVVVSEGLLARFRHHFRAAW